MNPRTNTPGQFTFTSCLSLALTMATALFGGASAFAADTTLNGANGGAVTGDGSTVTVSSAGGSGAYSYSYTLPDGSTGTTSIAYWKMGANIASPPSAGYIGIGTVNNVTVQSDQYTVNGGWAYLTASGTATALSNRSIIALTEPAAGVTNTVNLNNVMIASVNTGNKGVLALTAGGGNLIINGNIILEGNYSTGKGTGINGAAGAGATTFTGNVVLADNLCYGNSGAGAWFDGSGQTVTFQGNIFVLSNTSFGAHTGGIYFGASGGVSGTIAFQGNAVFENNYEAGTAASDTKYSGGALWIGTNGTLLMGGTSIFTGNTAMNQGGAIAFYGQGDGSAPYVYDVISGPAYFINNSVQSDPNVIEEPQSTGGGAINLSTNHILTFSNLLSVVGNSAIANNHLAGGTGQGGAFSMSGSSYYDIANTTGAPIQFLNNVAAFLDGTGTKSGGGNGGAVYGSGGTNATSLVINAPKSSVTFNYNAAYDITGSSGVGGAIDIGSFVAITGSTIAFVGNQASGNGGAIYVNTSSNPDGSAVATKVELHGAMNVSDNISGGSGGVIYAYGDHDAVSNILIEGSGTFANNAAAVNGGAIYATGATSTVTLNADTGNLIFTGNKQGATVNASAFDPYAVAAGAHPQMTASGGTPNDIYFAYTGATLDLETPAASNTISFDGGLASADPTTAVNVVKNGAGAVVFDTAASNLMTNTVVNAGVFKLLHGATYGAGGTFTLAGAGATLAGKGTMLENVTASAGSIITVGELNDTAAATLAFGAGLTLNGGVTLNYDLFNPADYDQITIAGDLIATGTNFIDLASFALPSGDYMLMTVGGLLTGGISNFALESGGAAYTGTAVTLSFDAANNLILNYSSGLIVNGTNTWTGTSGSWMGSVAGGMDDTFDNGNRVIFGELGSSSSIAITGNVAVTQMDVASAADYTFGGNGGITSSATAANTALTDGTGKLVKTGNGALNFTNAGANTFEGGIDIHAGEISFTSAAQMNTAGAAITFLDSGGTLRAAANNLTLANPIVIDPGATATIDTGTNKLTYTGIIDPPGVATLAKTGSGVLLLTEDNSGYTDATKVSQGSLLLAGASAALGGAVSVDAGATAGGVGAYTGTLTATAGATIQVGAGAGASAPGVLNIASLVLDNATVSYDFISSGQVSGTINAANRSYLGTNTININGQNSGIYDLGNIGDLLAASGSYLFTMNGVLAETGGRQSASLSNVGGQLMLNFSAATSGALTWTGKAGSGTWDAATANWQTGTPAASTSFAPGDYVIFNNTGAAAGNISLGALPTYLITGMTVQGTSSYTFTGNGGINASSANLNDGDASAITAAGYAADGKLVMNSTGMLTFANTGTNTFADGIEMKSGALAFSNPSQILTTGTNISFTGDSALFPNANGMTMANNISIADGVTAAINTAINTSGYNLTITGALTATGTGAILAKAGVGTLTLAGANSAYTGAIASAAGTLNLSSATPTVWTVAYAMSDATITGGANDTIALTQGLNYASNITGSLSVIIDAPVTVTTTPTSTTITYDVAQLTGTNTYAGYTTIKSGMLRISAGNQLGATGANARPLVFDSGTGYGVLDITGNMTAGRGFQLTSGDATVQVRDGVTAIWTNITETTPGLNFNKNDSGVLVLTGSSVFTGQTNIGYGAIQINNAGALGSSLVNLGYQIAASSTEVTLSSGTLIAGANNMAVANNIYIAGAGCAVDTGTNTLTLSGSLNGTTLGGVGSGFHKNGAGTLILTSSNNSYGPTEVVEGILKAGAPQAIGGGINSSVTIDAGATLMLEGYAHTFSLDLTNNGALWVGQSAGPGANFQPSILNIGRNYYAATSSTLFLNAALDANNKLVTDQLQIAGKAQNLAVAGTGSTRIVLVTAASTAGNYNVLPSSGTPAIVTNTPLVVTKGGGLTDVFGGYGLDDGDYHYNFADNGANGLILMAQGYAPPKLGAVATDAASLFAGQAINESLSRRFAALRANDVQNRNGVNLWLNAFDRQDQITNNPYYNGAKCTTYGVQAGGDIFEYSKNNNSTFAAGAFFNYASGDIKVPVGGGRTQLNSTGGGVYGEVNYANWYAALMFRVNTDRFTISSDATPAFDAKGTSWGASIEGGYDFHLQNPSWIIEPQAQLTLARANINGATDANGYYYSFDTVQSTIGRAGIKAFKSFEYSTSKLFTPYVRMSIERDKAGNGTVTVNANSANAVTNNLSGVTMILDGGVACQITKRLDFNADAAWYYGNRYKSYSLNAGLRYFW